MRIPTDVVSKFSVSDKKAKQERIPRINGWREIQYAKCLLTFKIRPDLTQIFIVRVTNVHIMTAAMEGDSYQHCPHDIGDPNCIKSNSSSGRKIIFSFQLFPKLPIS